MKAIYEFEKELLKEYNFEPINEGYNIDDLGKTDRIALSGMLWILFDAVEKWKCAEKRENEENGTVGKIENEYFDNAYKRLVGEIIYSVQNFVVSTIDSYPLC